MRHRMTLQDLTLLVAAVLVTAYVLLEIDVFVEPGAAMSKKAISADELPILGAVLCIGLLAFAWRRARQHKFERAARLEAQDKLSRMAFQDTLTGLPNRHCLVERLNRAIASPPAAGAMHALMMLDLNGFKRINDVHGHGAGDQTLIVVGQRLLGAVREGDLVARLGGDELAIVATHLSSSESATSLARRVLDALSHPIVTNRTEHRVGAGIGICLIPINATTADEALRRADAALYKAKSADESALCYFDDAMEQQVHERDTLEQELRLAISAEQIEPYFQPIVELETNRIVGFEALARWTHPTLGSVAPERFIAVAEDIGLIAMLTDQLLAKACKAALTWPAHIRLSFNVSAIELRDAQLVERVFTILKSVGIAPERLEIEITESALMQDVEQAKKTLFKLRQAGVSIALDDFGTGYSSLYHLRNFAIDKIKIDRSFVSNMNTEHESGEIVAAMIGLGRGLGLTITAEGVEGQREEDKLLDLGCQQGQGFLFGKAISNKDALTLLGTVQSAGNVLFAQAKGVSLPRES